MGLFSRKSETTTTTTPATTRQLPATMPTRMPDDPRGKGHETTFQSSRGGWFKKG
jgi:hypothetical protein